MITIYCQQKQFKGVAAVIFDKDGTLADTSKALVSLAHTRAKLIDEQIPGVLEPLLKAFGVQGDSLDREGLMAVGSKPENEIAAAAYIAQTGCSWWKAKTIAAEAFSKASQLHQNFLPPLMPGTTTILKQLTAAGIKVAILSNDTTEAVGKLVEAYGLSNYVQVAMGATAQWSKPDPALYYHCCGKLGVEPGATLMVGDSEGDWKMAQAAGALGAIAIIMDRDHSFSEPDLVINNLLELQIRP